MSEDLVLRSALNICIAAIEKWDGLPAESVGVETVDTERVYEALHDARIIALAALRKTPGDWPATTPPGVYQHHKGPKYLVKGVVKDSTNARAGDLLVLYESLEGENIGDEHVRHEGEFNQKITWPDGQLRPRFVRLL